MSLTYGFYNAINNDRTYNATQMSSLFDGIIRDGVFASIGDALMVSAVSGMDVNVGIGRAWFNHTWTNNDAPLVLTVPQSELVLNRIDVVVLEVNSTDAVRANNIKIIKGTPASNPVAPAMTRNDFVNQYPLCHIYVKAGVTIINQADITNKIGTSDCPFITGVLQTINIDSLIAQWNSEFDIWFNDADTEFRNLINSSNISFNDWLNDAYSQFTQWMNQSVGEFDTWFDTIKGKLSSDVAGSLQSQIDELKASPIKQQATEPIDAPEGTLWLDTSDTGWQGTELEAVKEDIENIKINITDIESDLANITQDIVTSAQPNRVLKLNANSKLPASITGDAVTVNGLYFRNNAGALEWSIDNAAWNAVGGVSIDFEFGLVPY